MESIYLDNAATTRVDEGVARHVVDVMRENYGNASSLHDVGKRARVELEGAREKIASYIGCEAEEIIFTSGGTESNNLAIRGVARANPEKKHIITSVIEHPSVLDVCLDLEGEGYTVDYLDVDERGMVSLEELESKIREDTLMVSIMHANNEIGVFQDVEEIGIICRGKGVIFHTDNVQGFLKEPLALASIDLMSVSGHKVHAPKGIGFLYVKHGVKIKGIFEGGGHERGLRSGTENVPGAVGLAFATELDFKIDEVRHSRERIMDGLLKIPGTKINGDKVHRLYNNVNVSFWGIEGESLMMMLNDEGLYVSTGSACASTKLKESYVLKALGVDEMYIHGSIRISMDKDVIGKEDYVVEKIRRAVEKLRSISPFKFSEENLGGSQAEVAGGSNSESLGGSHSSNVEGSASLESGATDVKVDEKGVDAS